MTLASYPHSQEPLTLKIPVLVCTAGLRQPGLPPQRTYFLLPLRPVHGNAGSLSSVLTLRGGLPRIQVAQMQGPGLAGYASDGHVCAKG